jgi:hypothetical protein
MASMTSIEMKLTEHMVFFFFIFTGEGASQKAVVSVIGEFSLMSYQLPSGSRANLGLSSGVQETPAIQVVCPF